MTIEHIRGMVDGDNRDVIIKGLIDYDNLMGRDKITFDHLMIGLMTAIEAKIVSNDIGLLDDQQPDGFGLYLRTRLLPYGGMQAWWMDTKDLFSPIVQSWVASQIAKTDMESNFLGIKSSASG
ncbi:MAG: hypothetical protein HOI35_09550 [Woeseia sp.]|jgi:hypothetical protein|nr:hypothetical protein [Woeseia sp.]MBT6210250.1 hypothetical protein [Woeseia sp.]